MTLDVRPSLGALIDGVTTNAGGRKQRFQYIPWGRHWDDRRWAAIQNDSARVSAGTAPDSVISIRAIANPTEEANVGGDAAKNRQVLDIMLWWQDGADITGPDAFRAAVVNAVKAIVRANKRTTSPATFVTVIDVRDGDELMGGQTGTIKHLAIVTVRAEGHELYG